MDNRMGFEQEASYSQPEYSRIPESAAALSMERPGDVLPDNLKHKNPLPVPIPIPIPMPIPVPGDCRFDNSCFPRRPSDPPPIDIDLGDEYGTSIRNLEKGKAGAGPEPCSESSRKFPPDCSISQTKTIEHENGLKSTLTFGFDGEKKTVDEFVSVDGVRYKRVELLEHEKEILESKLGRDVPAGFSAWVVEGGGINKSNGNSDKRIIASVDFDCKTETVKAKTIWPVPQETVYNPDSSFQHSMAGGARTDTRLDSSGVETVKQDWPGSSFEREISTDSQGGKRILDRDKKSGKIQDQTYKYQLW